MKGKLIVIEGTDCSGKETQTRALVENLNNIGIKSIRLSFPMYDTPTGKIIGGAFLGKENIDIKPVFLEKSTNVPAKVASLFMLRTDVITKMSYKNTLMKDLSLCLIDMSNQIWLFKGVK